MRMILALLLLTGCNNIHEPIVTCQSDTTSTGYVVTVCWSF